MAFDEDPAAEGNRLPSNAGETMKVVQVMSMEMVEDEVGCCRALSKNRVEDQVSGEGMHKK